MIVYARASTTIPLPVEFTAVHDQEGHALPARAGKPLQITGQPVHLSG